MTPSKNKTGYIEMIGRRKTSVARVRIEAGAKQSVTINGRDLATYFPVKEHQEAVLEPFKKSEVGEKFGVTIKVVGGGMTSQAEAIRLGVSRALVEYKAELRGALKKEGFLKRDPRIKERRKFGLKKARKAPQWSKR